MFAVWAQEQEQAQAQAQKRIQSLRVNARWRQIRSWEAAVGKRPRMPPNCSHNLLQTGSGAQHTPGKAYIKCVKEICYA